MNIRISRYPAPTDEERATAQAEHPGVRFPSDEWDSYIEPEDGGWIIFVGTDGRLVIYTRREPTGGVVGEPTVLEPAPA